MQIILYVIVYTLCWDVVKRLGSTSGTGSFTSSTMYTITITTILKTWLNCYQKIGKSLKVSDQSLNVSEKFASKIKENNRIFIDGVYRMLTLRQQKKRSECFVLSTDNIAQRYHLYQSNRYPLLRDKRYPFTDSISECL
jgi:hypothetical protein